MLNHTYTSVKNANLVDCGKKQHISSQLSPLLKDNFLGEFRTELDRKKVLANLGIITDVSLEWEYIKGEIENSPTLVSYIENKTTYKSTLGEFKDKIISLIDGVLQLEGMIGSEDALEQAQNERLKLLEQGLENIQQSVTDFQDFLETTKDIDFAELQEKLDNVSSSIEQINSLIQISQLENNALYLQDDGLYVKDLSEEVNKISGLSDRIDTISDNLSNCITKDDIGEGPYDFVTNSDYSSYKQTVSTQIQSINSNLDKTIKIGSDGNVNKLGVNTLTKSTGGNIAIERSLERTSNAPLDIYGVVETLQELYALDPAICYAGMSVIVSSQSALYILRDPGDQDITEEYVKDSDSWKCPEDLVTQAVTIDKYEELVKSGAISDHIFYYVYEPEPLEEPNPKDYGGEDSEEYKKAYDLWLRYLGNHYMSAVWARQIEKSLSDKANKSQFDAVYDRMNQTDTRIKNIIGDGNELNLSGLNDRISQNTNNIESIGQQTSKIEAGIAELDSKFGNYVLVSDIYPEGKAAFASQTEFTNYIQSQEGEVVTDKVSTNEFELQNNIINISNTGILNINGNPIAFESSIPNMEIKSANDFNPNTAQEDTYYFIYDSDTTYVTSDAFENYKTSQTTQISAINSRIGNLPENTSLVDLIQKLQAKISELESKIALHHPTTE